MRIFSQLVFDDFIMGTESVYTAEQYNDGMGLADQFAIQAVADQVSGTTPTLTVQIQHSNDQRNWVDKSGTAEINAQSLSASATTVKVGTDSGSTPTLGYRRLKITLGGTTPVAHVKLFACGRDKTS